MHDANADAEQAALPATPQTLSSDKPMDSDDDLNSVASSGMLGEAMDDSSVDFDAAGESHHEHMLSVGL